ncbi:hypothetical protein [Epilithonimonas sp.]|uniref:hypothetical protein n=1 Tax=Epilithonimonas sp. TaxID=2894511 RepID=UPI0028A6C1BA|nr:hypothetical protein [Epilithonimonas sp.]
MPRDFNIYEAFVENLKTTEFEIELLFTSNHDFRYKNPKQRVTNFLRKTFLGDKNYKQNLKDRFNDDALLKELSKIQKKVDYTLVIRPDYFSTEILQKLKVKTNKLIAYQWDGLERYPKAKKLIPLFDRFFLFDVDDYERYKSNFQNIFPITNFYFDFDKNLAKSINNEVFFIGSFIESRIDKIVHLTKNFVNLGLNPNINLLAFDDETPRKYSGLGLNFITTGMTYLEVLEKVRKAAIVLDFANSVHNGLSFRTFEAIYFSKKLITNNPLVMKYDFYHPNNILVLDQSMGEEDIKQFLSADYIQIDDTIKTKYSFTNWLKTVFKD